VVGVTAVKLSDLAAKARRDPYELDPEDGGDVITIAQPSIAQWKMACESATVDGFLSVLGVPVDDANRVSDVMTSQDLGTEAAFVADIRKHFGLGN
jgi:hypothetical protein